MPEFAGAGRSTISTFLPVCSPTPVARIEFLSVRCRSMLVGPRKPLPPDTCTGQRGADPNIARGSGKPLTCRYFCRDAAYLASPSAPPRPGSPRNRSIERVRAHRPPRFREVASVGLSSQERRDIEHRGVLGAQPVAHGPSRRNRLRIPLVADVGRRVQVVQRRHAVVACRPRSPSCAGRPAAAFVRQPVGRFPSQPR